MNLKYFNREQDPALFQCRCGNCDTRPSPELLMMVDAVRHKAGIPMICTSGPRCQVWNDANGGSKFSEHVDGDGADFAVASSRARFLIVQAALDCGVTRIGIAKSFVHLGVSKTNDQEVIWTYG